MLTGFWATNNPGTTVIKARLKLVISIFPKCFRRLLSQWCFRPEYYAIVVCRGRKLLGNGPAVSDANSWGSGRCRTIGSRARRIGATAWVDRLSCVGEVAHFIGQSDRTQV